MHSKYNTGNADYCGGWTVVKSGALASWVTITDGTKTKSVGSFKIDVPKTAVKSSTNQLVTLTFSKDKPGKESGTANSTNAWLKKSAAAKKAFVITITGVAAPAAAVVKKTAVVTKVVVVDSSDSVAVAVTTVVGGVLAGSMMAASFMAAPPPPTPAPAPSSSSASGKGDSQNDQ